MAKPESSVPEKYAAKAEEILKQLARQYLGGATVILFGSRADGTHSRRSDFDIAYMPGENFDSMSVVRFREAIEESDVIYGVDLVDLSQVEDSFRDTVLSEGVVWKS